MFFGSGFPQQEFYMRRAGGRWMRQQDVQAQHTHSQVYGEYMLTFVISLSNVSDENFNENRNF